MRSCEDDLVSLPVKPLAGTFLRRSL